MKENFIRKFILPPGPILSMTLVGLLMLSALLYYRSVKIQRFLEPALAISEPRMEFHRRIYSLLTKEFGTTAKWINYKNGSIFIDQSMLYSSAHGFESSNQLVFKKLGRVFLSALGQVDIKRNISLILVSINFRLTRNTKLNYDLRLQIQARAALILNLLYAAEPELENKFAKFFAVTAMPSIDPEEKSGWVEFRMVPTERLHIDVIESLEQYSY
jgi:hypothetical protein